MSTRERIKLALERSNKSQRDLAQFMGLKSPTVSAMLAKDEIDSIKYLKAVEELTGFSFEWLRTGEGPQQLQPSGNRVEEPEMVYWHEKLSSKDELIEELKARIADLKKYQELLEKQIREKNG
jgi:transcriptional regulator with XRE-family HTH domain